MAAHFDGGRAERRDATTGDSGDAGILDVVRLGGGGFFYSAAYHRCGMA